jgi:hypothetical protein
MENSESEGTREAAAELSASLGQSEGNYQKTKNNKATCRNFLPTFRYNISGPSSRVKFKGEDGTDRLSRNVGKELPLYSA